jgi:hypothetical protein
MQNPSEEGSCMPGVEPGLQEGVRGTRCSNNSASSRTPSTASRRPADLPHCRSGAVQFRPWNIRRSGDSCPPRGRQERLSAPDCDIKAGAGCARRGLQLSEPVPRMRVIALGAGGSCACLPWCRVAVNPKPRHRRVIHGAGRARPQSQCEARRPVDNPCLNVSKS